MVSAPGKPVERGFYEQSLTEAERADLPAALKVKGLEQEIAALRLRLRSVIEKRPEDVALMLRGMDVLRRLVVTRYGLSKEDALAFKSVFAEETLRRVLGRGEGGDGDDVT